MQATIRKWGNSPAVRLSASALREAGYRLDQRVEIKVTPGRIVIEPTSPLEYRLSDLLDAIAPDNLHEDIDFGVPVGRESL